MSESRRLLLLKLHSCRQLSLWQNTVCRVLRSGVCLLQRAANRFDQKLAEQISNSEKADSAQH
ncbi:hypothetical protein [Amphritea sp.]|uniref:hypothetical protein n=1 Tax=Amphritea sp. TaxID=1872502 RepID=UPI003D134BF9